jgi:hypothetical protein
MYVQARVVYLQAEYRKIMQYSKQASIHEQIFHGVQSTHHVGVAIPT